MTLPIAPARTATASGGTQEFRASRLLVALGRRPVTDGLNLEAVDVKTGDLGEMVVDERALVRSQPEFLKGCQALAA